MRRRVSQWSTLLFVGGLVVGASPAHAEVVDRMPHPIRKLGRGLANAIGGVLEISLKIQEVGLEKGPVAGITLGLLLGTAEAIGRIMVGALEIITFPFPLGQHGYEPLLLPEFILEPGSYPTSTSR